MPHHILVVDDDNQIARLIRSYLEQNGFQVTVAHDGETFEAGQLTNGDLVVSIREESGRPLWAGGRGGGQGRTG